MTELEIHQSADQQTTYSMQRPMGKAITFSLVLALVATSPVAWGHGKEEAKPAYKTNARAISFPDLADKQTLVVDLHTHTVFSDGHVWPKIRVGEAVRDGLDAMAVTEHLEYQPHLADIPHPDRNRAIVESQSAAEGTELLILPGSEITRQEPAGHINAIFLDDANKLLNVEQVPADPSDTLAYYAAAGAWPAEDAVAAANEQGAFVFWNHPYWTQQTPDGIARITNFHKKLVRKKQLHGIEIANGDTYSEEAFAIALKHDLVPIGVSDIHDLIDWDYEPHNGGHRPVNLVFTANRSIEGIKAALFAGDTVVWFKNQLMGRMDQMRPLLDACLSLEDVKRVPQTELVSVTIKNTSDAEFELQNLTKLTFMEGTDSVRVPPHGSTTLMLKGNQGERVNLKFTVQNALVAPKKHPVVVLNSGITPLPVATPEGAGE